MQGSKSVAGLALDVGALGQQQGHHVGFAPLGSHVQWTDVVLGGVVDVGALFDQQVGDRLVSIMGCDVERGES